MYSSSILLAEDANCQLGYLLGRFRALGVVPGGCTTIVFPLRGGVLCLVLVLIVVGLLPLFRLTLLPDFNMRWGSPSYVLFGNRVRALRTFMSRPGYL